MTNNKSENHSKPVKVKFFYGYTIVAVSLLMMTTAWIPFYAFGVFFTPMLTEFGWTRAVTSGAISGTQIMRGLSGIVMGRLNDKIGPRKVLTGCALLLGAGFMLMHFIHSLWQFYLFFTILVGIGLSGFWVPLVSTAARWFVQKRATMSGIVMMATGIATLVGAPIANLLLSIYDWRLSYLIMGIAVLLVIPVSAQFLRGSPAEIGQFPDGEKRQLEMPRVVLAGFSLAQAIRTRQFWMYFIATGCNGYALSSITVHIVPYALTLNISSLQAASLLATFGGFSLSSRLVLGSSADKVGERNIYQLGFIITTLSFLLLIMSKQTWMLYLFAAIFGFAGGGMGTVGSPLLAEFFGLRSHGLIFGLANMGYTIGAALGPVITGYIFDVTGGYQMAFVVCPFLGLLGIIMAYFLRKSAVLALP